MEIKNNESDSEGIKSLDNDFCSDIKLIGLQSVCLHDQM